MGKFGITKDQIKRKLQQGKNGVPLLRRGGNPNAAQPRNQALNQTKKNVNVDSSFKFSLGADNPFLSVTNHKTAATTPNLFNFSSNTNTYTSNKNSYVQKLQSFK